MAKELLKYRLRGTKKPATWQDLLASTVTVQDEIGRHGYCYINFDKCFLSAVGKALPRGLSPRNPAYLRVEYEEKSRRWLIGAQYLGDKERPVVLWQTSDKPGWLRYFTTYKSTV